jgi:raffinose/stachyose/melibiose transport system permease protein
MPNLRIKTKSKRNIALYAMLLPTLFLYILFFVYPVINGLSFGFYRYSGVSQVKYFIGLRNYFQIAVDPQFQLALYNTVVITIVNSVAQFAIGFGLAWLARKYGRVGSIFLSVALIPIVLSFVSVGLMWQWFYNPSFGLLNALVDFFHVNSALNFIGLPSVPRSLTANPSTSLFSILLAANWQGIGLYAVIYSAGLRTISPSIYDSMKVDGLSDLQKIRRVIWPMMKDTIALALVLVIAASFKIFELVYVLTGGGPGRLTDVISIYLYRYYASFQAGYASAVAFYILMIGLLLVLFQFRFLRTEK